jgi:glycosyltransferase involved in cell wall biosynthesis
MFRDPDVAGGREVGVSVIAPFRNEAKNLPWFIEHVPEWIDEVIFVDGNSNDGSAEVIASLMPRARVLHQPGRGKGNALAYGMVNSTQDIVIAVDTDGSMDPRHSDSYIRALLNGADLVKGSRYLPGGGSDDLTKLRDSGNKVLTIAANVIFRQKWSELCYGYFALWTKNLHALDVDNLIRKHGTDPTGLSYGSGFEIETLMFCRAVRNKMKVVEVPSFEAPRTHGQSSLRTFRDGFRVVWGIGVERLRRVHPTVR